MTGRYTPLTRREIGAAIKGINLGWRWYEIFLGFTRRIRGLRYLAVSLLALQECLNQVALLPD
jgi:hypothetical protein